MQSGNTSAIVPTCGTAGCPGSTACLAAVQACCGSAAASCAQLAGVGAGLHAHPLPPPPTHAHVNRVWLLDHLCNAHFAFCMGWACLRAAYEHTTAGSTRTASLVTCKPPWLTTSQPPGPPPSLSVYPFLSTSLFLPPYPPLCCCMLLTVTTYPLPPPPSPPVPPCLPLFQFMESLIRAFPLIEVSIRTSSRKLRSVLDVFYQAVKTGQCSIMQQLGHLSSLCSAQAPHCTITCLSTAQHSTRHSTGCCVLLPAGGGTVSACACLVRQAREANVCVVVCQQRCIHTMQAIKHQTSGN